MTFQTCRNLVRVIRQQRSAAASVGEDQDAIALENEGKKLADHWVDREKDNLRGLIDYDAIRDSAIVDVFTGNVKMSPKQLELLKQQIGEEAVDKIVAAAKQGAEAAPTVEQAPEKLQKDNTLKPLLNAPRLNKD